MKTETDIEYDFEISESLKPDYRMASKISKWLHDNLEGLTDDNDKIIFDKVNYGYNSETLKTFAGKPVCDIYIDHIDYDENFDDQPMTVHSIIIFYIKGANDIAYLKCCDLHDYLIQEFLTNENLQCLDGVVKETHITNSELMNQTVNKRWGVLGALELSHTLY